MGILSDHVAVVTGGATGIGLASATRLAAEGATVVMARRDATQGEDAAEAIRGSGGRATFVKAAVASMTRAAALELAGKGIDVVAISPWVVDTPMVDGLTGGRGPQARAAFAAAFAPSGNLHRRDR